MPSINYTPEQDAAIHTLKGPLNISAGAGTGKTFTLSQRIAYALSDECECDVNSIDEVMAITFTEAAAAEIKSRVRSVLQSKDAKLAKEALKVDDAWISTIHGMCARILRTHALELGIDPGFEVIMEEANSRLLEQAVDTVLSRDFKYEDLYSDEAQAAQDLYVLGYSRPSSIKNDDDLRELLSDVYELCDVIDLRAASHYNVSVLGNVSKIISLASSSLSGFEGMEFGNSQEPLNVRSGIDRILESARNLRDEYRDASSVGKLSKTGAENLDELETRIATLGEISSVANLSTTDMFEILNSFQKLKKIGQKNKENIDKHEGVVAEFVYSLKLEFTRQCMNTTYELAQLVYAIMSKSKREAGVLTNDDLLVAAHRALQIDSIRNKYANKFKLVMIDEFQDTDSTQIELVRSLAGENSQYLCTVGDVQQSIYSFRGADVGVYKDYVSSLNDGANLTLTSNFRSHSDILAFVEKICSTDTFFGEDFLSLSAGHKNSKDTCDFKRITLSFDYASGKVEKAVASSATNIANYFQEMHEKHGFKLSDMALLLRNMTNAEVFANAIRDKGFPCVVAGGSILCETAEAKTVVSLALALANPHNDRAMLDVLTSEMFNLCADDLLVLTSRYDSRDGLVKACSYASSIRSLVAEFLRVGKCGSGIAPLEISDAILNVVEVFARAHSAKGVQLPDKIVTQALMDSGWIARLEARGVEGVAVLANIFKVIRLVQDAQDLEGFDMVGAVAYLSGYMKSRPKLSPGALSSDASNSIKIMSVHGSKGLEFPVVALAGFSNHTMPKKKGEITCVRENEKIYLSMQAVVPSPLNKKCYVNDLKSPKEKDDESFETELVSVSNAETLLEHHLNVLALSEQKDSQEAQRLFYVGATRAKDALYYSISCTSGAANENSSLNLNLAGVNAQVASVVVPNGDFASAISFEYGGQAPADVFVRKAGAGVDVDSESAKDVSSGVEDTNAEMFSTYNLTNIDMPRVESVHAKNAGLVSFSSLYKDCERIEFNDDEHQSADVRIDDPLLFGSAAHKLMELSALHSVEFSESRLSAVAQKYAVADLGRLQNVFEKLTACDIFQEATKYKFVQPEYPFVIRVSDTHCLQGIIDLLCYDTLGDKAVILDYKTGVSSQSTLQDLQNYHSAQAGVYALAALRQGFSEVVVNFALAEHSQSQVTVVSYHFVASDICKLSNAIQLRITEASTL